jgi:hypothetical protein
MVMRLIHSDEADDDDDVDYDTASIFHYFFIITSLILHNFFISTGEFIIRDSLDPDVEEQG